MCQSNEQVVNTIVLMIAGYQYGLVNQRVEGISDLCFESQKPGIMNPARTRGRRTGRPSPRSCRRPG